MAKTKSQSKPTKNTQPQRATSGKKVLGIGAIVIAIIIALCGVFYLTAVVVPMTNEQGKMERYLKEKYGKEFVVNDIKNDSAVIGSRAYRAYAYPVDDMGLKFEVKHSVSSSRYGDQYLWTLWNRDNKSGLEQEARLLPDHSNTLGLSISIVPSAKLSDQMVGRVITYDEALRQSQRDIGLNISLMEQSPYSEQLAVKNADYIAYAIKHFTANKSFIVQISYVGKTNDGRSYSCYLSDLTTEEPVDNLMSCLTPKNSGKE